VRPNAIRSALDLCTGSGCLAVLMAHVFPDAQIDAVDISPDALAVAKINVEKYAMESQINLIQSDLFTKLNKKKYDLIISNPPYVTTSSMQALPQEYRHEPSLALAAGVEGLDAVKIILQQAPSHLNPKGVLVVEVGNNRDIVEAAYPQLELNWLETSHGSESVFLIDREHLT
jgi:ribosomal protein L3 glutamine methyltransferase